MGLRRNLKVELQSLTRSVFRLLSQVFFETDVTVSYVARMDGLYQVCMPPHLSNSTPLATRMPRVHINLSNQKCGSAVQMAKIGVNNILMWNAKHGFGRAHRRYVRNWRELRSSWEALLTEVYERPMPEDSRAFWASIRRAYPDALSDHAQYEGQLRT